MLAQEEHAPVRNTLNNQLTIIITASYIKSHPSIKLIKKVLNSVKKINHNNSHIILAHDYNNNLNYQKYLKKLNQYLNNQNNSNIQVITRSSKGHLTGNIRNAMQHVQTKYLLVMQHDLPFIKKLNIHQVIEDMENNQNLKHIRFFKKQDKNPKNPNNLGWEFKNNLFGQQVQSKNYSYTRTPAWSDQNHLCTTSYYQDIVLKECPDGNFMEATLNDSLNEHNHEKYGTYLFGDLQAKGFITHLDGSKALKISFLNLPYRFIKNIEKKSRHYLKNKT